MTQLQDTKKDAEILCLGQELSSRRNELNFSIKFIANSLNVKEQDISAIEKNDLSGVSKNLYLYGIVSAYSKIVGLDKNIVSKKYKDFNSNSKDNKKTKEKLRMDDSQNHSPDRDIFVISLMSSVILILILLFYYNYTIKTSHNEVHDFIKSQDLK